ncbi:MAG TPA: hypothetical protein VNA31_06995, partial [bacterium]|nr:hypothetical protein [bacterium]
MHRPVLLLQIVLTTACAVQRGPSTPLPPPPMPIELGLAAIALEDSSLGPFFPPERLNLGVALLRRIYYESPVVMPSRASELSWHPSLQFRMTDLLFKSLFGIRADPPGGFVNHWLNPPRTGLPGFDSITTAMGGAVAILIQGFPPCCGFLTVYYHDPVNIPGVARAYTGLEPAVTISIFQGLVNNTGDIADRMRIEAGDTI